MNPTPEKWDTWEYFDPHKKGQPTIATHRIYDIGETEAWCLVIVKADGRSFKAAYPLIDFTRRDSPYRLAVWTVR